MRDIELAVRFGKTDTRISCVTRRKKKLPRNSRNRAYTIIEIDKEGGSEGWTQSGPTYKSDYIDFTVPREDERKRGFFTNLSRAPCHTRR